MRRCDIGGTVSVRSLRPRSVANGHGICRRGRNGAGTLDEMFVRINGKLHYLWRAVDHEGEVLEAYVTKRRDRKAALKFLRQAMKTVWPTGNGRHRQARFLPGSAENDRQRRAPGNRPPAEQPGENSHQPLRRRERAMQRFRRMGSLQKFAAVHSSVYNHFNQERHLYSRKNFKLNRAAALAEWRELSAA